MDRGDSPHGPLLAVKGDELPDIDIGNAVAIGDAERFVALQVFPDLPDSRAGHRVLSRLGKRHGPGMVAPRSYPADY